jgi:hypothetical protein
LVVVKPDAIWIEADGLRTDGREFFTVCKLHEVFNGVLMKVGNVEDYEHTYSTDDDVKLLIDTKKSFANFQRPAAEILRRRVEKEIEETIGYWKTIHPERFLSEDILREPPSKQEDFSIDIELVYATVEDGKPAIYELYVGPTAQPVTDKGGLIGYKWVIENPVWKIRPSKVEAIYYPSIDIGPEDQIRLTSKPDIEMPIYFRGQEAGYPCVEQPPNVFLRVSSVPVNPQKRYSRSAKKKLMQTTIIEHGDHGACPSWEALTIPKPEACLASQLRQGYRIR